MNSSVLRSWFLEGFTGFGEAEKEKVTDKLRTAGYFLIQEILLILVQSIPYKL